MMISLMNLHGWLYIIIYSHYYDKQESGEYPMSLLLQVYFSQLLFLAKTTSFQCTQEVESKELFTTPHHVPSLIVVQWSMGLQNTFKDMLFFQSSTCPVPALLILENLFTKYSVKQIFDNPWKFISSKISHPTVFDVIIMLLINILFSGYACVGLIVIETLSDY